jgi:glycogen debranching enzyme
VRFREIVRIDLAGGAPRTRVRPGLLTLTTDRTAVEVALSGVGRVHLRVLRGEVTLDLQVRDQYDVVVQQGPGRWTFIDSGANQNYLLRVRHGRARLGTTWDGVRDTRAELHLTADEEPVHLVLDEHGSTPPPADREDLDAVAAQAEHDFADWLAVSAGPALPADRWEDAVRLAAYVTWSALVPAGGALRRESMLMSKNHMANVWSWDHCFNAMALWRDPDAAADQLLTIFDHQDEHGALPDYVNDLGTERNFVKPPIHGWAIAHLLDRGGLRPEHVAALHDPLARWTRWWFAHRDHRGDGVPSYHHGNDSGWDNATVFGQVVPVQSPDLLAFLALQMDALGRTADLLDRPEEARTWREDARRTVDLLLANLWLDGRFVARETHTQQVIPSDSLLTLMPLALGDLLPPEVFAATVARLEHGGYLTAHGPATEPVTSPYYEPDGYWRGPVWAPTTLLLVDGLRRGGRADLAGSIAERFVATCAAEGMAENFDALTGAGLRDRSMTWTASVLLLLARP